MTSGHVYLCRNKRNGYVKIGFSKNPELREKTLQSEEPDVFFEKMWPGTIEDEQELHRKYAQYRIRGEWFELCPAQVSEIGAYFSSFNSKELSSIESAKNAVRSGIEALIELMSEDELKRLAVNAYDLASVGVTCVAMVERLDDAGRVNKTSTKALTVNTCQHT